MEVIDAHMASLWKVRLPIIIDTNIERMVKFSELIYGIWIATSSSEVENGRSRIHTWPNWKRLGQIRSLPAIKPHER
jgi:hypothetical protein